MKVDVFEGKWVTSWKFQVTQAPGALVHVEWLTVPDTLEGEARLEAHHQLLQGTFPDCAVVYAPARTWQVA